MAAPINLSGYPQIVLVTGTTVSAYADIDQSGIIYAVIVPQASGAPSAAQIAAGTDSANVSVPAGWSTNVLAISGVPIGFQGSGLVSQTAYEMYVVASGTDPSGTLQAAGVGLPFTTLDVTGPTWYAGYPTLSNLKGRTAKVNMALSETGSGFYVIVPTATAVAPSAAQIRAGTDASSVAIPSGLAGTINLIGTAPSSSTVTNLVMAHNYTIYVTARDTSGNDVTPLAVSSANFRSAGGGMPGKYSPQNIAKERAKTANRLTNALRTIGR